MGEKSMDILETNVKHNTEDIRELKKRMENTERDVSDLKANLQVTNQTMTHIMESINELKSDFRIIDDKLDKNQIEQLQEYKNGVWKIGVTVISALIGGFLLFFFGLK